MLKLTGYKILIYWKNILRSFICVNYITNYDTSYKNIWKTFNIQSLYESLFKSCERNLYFINVLLLSEILKTIEKLWWVAIFIINSLNVNKMQPS